MIHNTKNGILLTMPKLFIIFIAMVIILPTVGMVFGFKLGVINWPHKTLVIYHALYYWSISIISVVIVLLALTHYQYTNDKVALSLGIAYLFAAYFNTAFTLSNEWIRPMTEDVENLHAYIWVLSNTLTGLLLVISFKLCLMKVWSLHRLKTLLFILLLVFIALNSYWFVSWLPFSEQLARIIHPIPFINHPFGLMNLVIYLYLGFAIYPKLKQFHSRILTPCIGYIVVAQILMSCYMMFGSAKIYDTLYLGALALQLCCYLIPFTGLIFSYLLQYDVALENQQKLQRQKERFEQLSTYDPLTGLLNRRAFEETTRKIIERSKRYGNPFSLIYLDLDNFKQINDTIGHDVGDELLKQVSHCLLQVMRTSDYCGRLGGDEFGVIFSEISDKAAVSAATEKLLRVLNRPFKIQENYYHTGACAGIALFPDAGITYQTLLKNADTAMYRAKAKGKNTYVFYTDSMSTNNH
ncbi:MAG: GGDEF domain-containing protein [Tatlockia sp.]|jgi:diguanylate cyclase (GGDEF)-like protein